MLENKIPENNTPKSTSPKKAKFSMKYALLAVVVVALVAVGYLYYKYTTGMEAYESGDYQTAIEILETTPFGKTVYIIASCKLAEQYLDAGEYKKAYNTLNDVAGDEYATIICRAAEECVQNGDYTTALSCVSLLSSNERDQQLETLAQLLTNQGNQEQADFFLGKNGNKPGMMYSYCKGMDSLDTAIFFDADETWLDRTLKPFQESGDYRDAKKYTEFIAAICNNQFGEATAILMAAYNDEPDTSFVKQCTEVLPHYAAKVRTSNETALDLAHYLPLKQLFHTQQAKDYDAAAMKSAIKGPDTVDAEPSAYRSEFGIGTLEELYAACGSNAAGKILIVTQYPQYTPGQSISSDQTINVISFDLMEHLPAAYYPKNLDEVSTVVIIPYGYIEVGEYTNYVPALQEYGYVFAYSAETGEYFYDTDITLGAEPPDSYREYGNGRSEFVSGGRPNLSEQLLEVLELIMELE